MPTPKSNNSSGKSPVVQTSLDSASFQKLTDLRTKEHRSQSAMAAILIRAGLEHYSQNSAHSA